MPLVETMTTAAVAFAATNIDDIIVLSVLFARRDEHLRAIHIVVGQYLGFTLLVAASLAVTAGLLALPDGAVGALGLVPIALGVRGLVRTRRVDDAADHDHVASATAMTTTGVASITVANGADNIAVYAPLFATFGTGGLIPTLLVFFGLVGVWCSAGRLIGSQPQVERLVERAGDYAIPVMLIALGIFIIAESGLPQSFLA